MEIALHEADVVILLQSFGNRCLIMYFRSAGDTLLKGKVEDSGKVCKNTTFTSVSAVHL